jgi:hypothetical protein
MDEIKGIARVKFHPGKVEEWKRLSKKAMETARQCGEAACRPAAWLALVPPGILEPATSERRTVPRPAGPRRLEEP